MSHATPTIRLAGLCPVSACAIVATGTAPYSGPSNGRADAFQAAVLTHIRLAHPSLFEQLSAVNLGLLVHAGASTFVRRDPSTQVATESGAWR